MIKIIKAVAKLNGNESMDMLASMAAGQSALRDNGHLATIFEADKQGKPTHIASYWVVSKFDNDKLQAGFHYAYIDQTLFDCLRSRTCSFTLQKND